MFKVAAERPVDLQGLQEVEVSVECPSMEITPESATVSVTTDAKVDFLCRPLPDCPPGSHDAVVLIQEPSNSGLQIDSVSFAINVRDYAFDHVSRPALTKVASAFSGIAASSLFVLTYLDKLDKALGMMGGTAAAILLGFFGVSHYLDYNRQQKP